MSGKRRGRFKFCLQVAKNSISAIFISSLVCALFCSQPEFTHRTHATPRDHNQASVCHWMAAKHVEEEECRERSYDKSDEPVRGSGGRGGELGTAAGLKRHLQKE
jgi:hypothetical protein